MKKLLFILCLTFGYINSQSNVILKVIKYPFYLAKLIKKSEEALQECKCTSNMCKNCTSIKSKQIALDSLTLKITPVYLIFSLAILIYIYKKRDSVFNPKNFLMSFLPLPGFNR